MKQLKAAVAGLLGSLVMYVIMMAGIHVSGIAPFYLPPSAAFLERFGLINVGPVALLLHFGYGAVWSIVLVELFKRKTSVGKGLGLGVGLWLIMMLVFTPAIGWGIFGFGTAGSLSPNDPLYLEPGPKFLIATLILHVIYGVIIGWMNSVWIEWPRVEKEPSATGRRARGQIPA